MPAIVEFETLPQLFTNLFDLNRGQGNTALAFKEKKSKKWVDISWESLQDQVNAVTGYLHKRGIKKGDRVGILSENRPEWAITDMATQYLGGANVSLYTSLPPSQVSYILKDSGAKVFVVSTSIQLRKAKEAFEECPELVEIITMSELRGEHPDYVRTWDDIMEEGKTYWEENHAKITPIAKTVKAEDLSVLIYTSGTTGNPKGVMLTHENIASNTKLALPLVPFGKTDHHLSFLPLCHSFERTCGYIAILASGALITYAESIDAVSKNITEVGPTVMISVPRLFEKIYNTVMKSVENGSNLKKQIFHWSVATGKKVAALENSGKSPGPLLKMQQSLGNKLVFSKFHEKLGGNLRFAVSGGAALPKAIGEFFQAAGIKILEGYGLTETSPILTVNPFDRPRYGSVGHVIPGVTVGIQRLSDNKIIGQQSGDNYPSTLSTEEGEIIARGPNIMKGYWNNEEATSEAIDPDGWYHTGDIGRFDNGYLLITDRLKHMIVSRGGKNIYPGPIEDGFKSETTIDQLMVVGEGREYLTALVVPSLDALKGVAKEEGVTYEKPSELLEHEVIQKHFKALFRKYSKTAAAHEKIRDFRLIEDPFTVENGMMTPTLKLKRKVVEKNYSELIESMYGVFA